MIELYILHAGITHKSPYFYNFERELKKHKNIKCTISPDLPNVKPEHNGIIYFNRLKRFYKSDDKNDAIRFMKNIDKLKKEGWKIVFTVHNFFPIDRDITEVDEYVTEEFLKRCDLVFTLSNYMKNSIEKNYNIKVINHGMGTNKLNKVFNKKIVKKINTNSKYTFSFVGNIYKYKMLNEVIKCFNHLENCKLIIAGTEPANSGVNINKIINNNENILFYNGFIGDSDWKKISKKTDCFINIYDLNNQSFKYGFFPSNFININNTGIQCISPYHKIVQELINDNQVIYYEFGNTSNLLEAMKTAIKRGKIKIKKSQRKKYSWKNTMNIFVNHCNDLFKE